VTLWNRNWPCFCRSKDQLFGQNLEHYIKLRRETASCKQSIGLVDPRDMPAPTPSRR